MNVLTGGQVSTILRNNKFQNISDLIHKVVSNQKPKYNNNT